MRKGGETEAAAGKSTRPRAAIIYHPAKIDLKRLKAAVNLVLEPFGWQPTLWLPTNAQETGAPQAKTAVASGATHLVVAGGDGTLRQVVQAVHDKPVSIGILPVGTGNILARNLGLPLNSLNTALRRALLGDLRPIDLGKAAMVFSDGKRQTQIFTALSGVGFDATIMINTNAKLKRRLGWIAYFDAGFKTLPAAFENLQLTVDDRAPRKLKVHSVLIGNCGFLPANIKVMPEARLDDGLLDVAAVGPRRFHNWIALLSRVTIDTRFMKRLPGGTELMRVNRNVKTLENLTGKHIELVTERPVNIQLDGDPFGKITKVTFDVLPNAMKLRC